MVSAAASAAAALPSGFSTITRGAAPAVYSTGSVCSEVLPSVLVIVVVTFRWSVTPLGA